METCIFCKIAAGQIKADVVYDDQVVMAFRDAHPQAPTHILIIPKKHIARIAELPEADASLLVNIHKAVLALTKSESNAADGFRLVTNSGVNAGQTVQHLHFHFMAGRKLSWPPG